MVSKSASLSSYCIILAIRQVKVNFRIRFHFTANSLFSLISINAFLFVFFKRIIVVVKVSYFLCPLVWSAVCRQKKFSQSSPRASDPLSSANEPKSSKLKPKKKYIRLNKWLNSKSFACASFTNALRTF